jgi:hypothetical protein
MKEIHVGPSGEIRFIHSDDLTEQFKAAEAAGDGGSVRIQRASHVEPDAFGDWIADLAPVGGPLLTGFKRRDEALAAEEDWLNANGLPVCKEGCR